MSEYCGTCSKKLIGNEKDHGCIPCSLDSGLSEYEFKNNLIIRLKNENERLRKVNDMLSLVCNGMRRVCAIARMVNNQRPDIRMTHAFIDYDINKLNDYQKEERGE